MSQCYEPNVAAKYLLLSTTSALQPVDRGLSCLVTLEMFGGALCNLETEVFDNLKHHRQVCNNQLIPLLMGDFTLPQSHILI
jgi:hypothetical protein